MQDQIPLGDREIALFLTHWNRSKNKLIAIDMETYVEHFPMIPCVRVVEDQTKKPISVLVDRLEAIKIVSDRNDMKHGKDVVCPNI